MDREPPYTPPEEPEGSNIIPFPVRNDDAERHRAKWRHPASGHETPQETYDRLGWEEDPDEPDEPDDPGSA